MNNIFELVNTQRKLAPNKTALVFEEKAISYDLLVQQVLKLSSGLKSMGVAQGQRIALLIPNGIEYAVVLLASAKLGIAVVPLPISLKGLALKRALDKASISLAIAWPSVSEALIKDALIGTDRLITLRKRVNNEVEWCTFLSDQVLDDELSTSDIDAPYILTMTSGSTGDPKPIILSQKCKISRAFDATINYYRLVKNDVILVSTPLYHSLGQRGVLMPLMLGATSVIMPKFNVKKWFQLIEEYKVTFLFAVSSQLESLLSEFQGSRDLSSLKYIISSSARLADKTKEALFQHLKCNLHECYGASEVGVVTDFCFGKHTQKRGSVGKPLPFVSLKIVDKNSHSLAPLEIGEICCQTTTNFNGYYELPEQTQSAYDQQGYFLTGDLGYLDEEGFLYYVGRNKEVISTGGINVYPQDIESVIKQHPLVSECVAFGVADKKFGEIIKVVYETVESLEVFNEIEIRKLCLEQLTDYQQPRILMRAQHLARSDLGKVLRNKVKLTYGIEE